MGYFECKHARAAAGGRAAGRLGRSAPRVPVVDAAVVPGVAARLAAGLGLVARDRPRPAAGQPRRAGRRDLPGSCRLPLGNGRRGIRPHLRRPATQAGDSAATAKRLGAIVFGTDVRKASKEEIESLEVQKY